MNKSALNLMFAQLAILSLTLVASSARASAPLDACKVLTATQIKSLMGLEFKDGENAPSNLGGSTCKFKQANGPGSVILQLGKASDYYEFKEKDNKPLTGFVSKGFYKGPNQGNAYAQAVKGEEELVLTVYAKKPYTEAQLKALIQDVAGRL